MAEELDRLEQRAQELRGRLALDLDELFVRLQPRRVIRDVGAYTRERVAAYGRDARSGPGVGREIVRDMRHNPIPYLLVGIGAAGLAWAVASFSRSRIRGRLPQFREADFVPPPPPRAAPARPAAPAAPPVTAASATPAAATRPVSPAIPADKREISPVTSTER